MGERETTEDSKDVYIHISFLACLLLGFVFSSSFAFGHPRIVHTYSHIFAHFTSNRRIIIILFFRYFFSAFKYDRLKLIEDDCSFNRSIGMLGDEIFGFNENIITFAGECLCESEKRATNTTNNRGMIVSFGTVRPLPHLPLFSFSRLVFFNFVVVYSERMKRKNNH